MTQQKKQYPLIKFLGTLTLLFTIGGVLSALGGQLGFFGDPEKAQESKKIQANGEIDNNLPPQVDATQNGKAPKYVFFDELTSRTTQLNQNGQTALSRAVANSEQKKQAQQIAKNVPTDADGKPLDKRETYRYMVQIGGFSRLADANRLKARAEKLGYPVEVISPRSKYLVQTGPFQGITNARAAQKYLKKNKFDTLIKRIKK